MLFCGAMAGAEVQRVVRVDAVGCRAEASLLGHCIEYGEKFIFAKEAAVGGVRPIRGIFHLMRFDEFVMDMEGANELIDCGAIVSRKTWRKCGNRKRAFTERTLRSPSQVCRIGAARQRDDQGAGFAKTREERNLLLLRRNARSFRNANGNERSHRQSV